MNNQNQILTIPMAIVVAAAIVGGALLYVFHPAQAPIPVRQAASAPGVPDTSALPPVTAADHILGNPNAPIKIVEYSDPSCPYCKMFQSTMLQVMQGYGGSGQVAWVYRQFPLDTPDANGNVLHPNAGAQSNAFECAAAIGGNAGFWAYEKDWFTVFPDNGADETATVDNGQLASVAKDVKLDAKKFADCLSSNQFSSKVDQEYQGGLAVGVEGTPTSYIVTSTGAPIPIQGAQPYTIVKAAIDAILADQGIATSTAAR